jgi:hypothetical protein
MAVESETLNKQPCTAAAASSANESSEPEPIIAGAAMPNEPEIVDQSPTPTPNHNPSVAISPGEEYIASVALEEKASTNQNVRPCHAAASSENESSEPEAVVEGNSGQDHPISSTTVMPNEPETATTAIDATVSPTLKQGDNLSRSATGDETIMSLTVKSITPTNQSDMPCTADNGSPSQKPS